MNREKWLIAYRKNKQAIWINVRLTNGEEHYCGEFSQWLEVRESCKEHGLFVEELSLQFRSHEVVIDINEAEGIYVIRSVMGQFGGSTKHYMTVGILKCGVVYKTMWLVPELIIEKEYEDDVQSCFEEAFIYDETQKNREE